MQTRDMYRPPNWKLVASVAAVSAVGIGGLALADTQGTENPPPITLTDAQAITPVAQVTVTTNLGFGPLSQFDSPFDVDDTGEASITGDTPQGLDTLTGDTPDAADVVESPVDDEIVQQGEEDSPVEAAAPDEETESPASADESPAG